MGLAAIYVNLIINGKWTFERVPDAFKPNVKALLIELDLEKFIEN